MAAIYQWFVNKAVVVTTTPYPIEVIESVEFDADVGAFNMRDIYGDDLESGWSFTTGELRVLLKSYGPDSDDVDSSWSFTTGEMRVLLREYGPDSDDVDVAWSFDAASLVLKLIQTQIYPHGLDMAPQLNSINMEDAP